LDTEATPPVEIVQVPPSAHDCPFTVVAFDDDKTIDPDPIVVLPNAVIVPVVGNVTVVFPVKVPANEYPPDRLNAPPVARFPFNEIVYDPLLTPVPPVAGGINAPPPVGGIVNTG
jgi:hypothetical protein